MICGSEYRCIPGTYVLPDNCGSYVIHQHPDTMEAYMNKITNASGDPYKHRLVFCNSFSQRFNMGNITPFWYVGPFKGFSIKCPKIPPTLDIFRE